MAPDNIKSEAQRIANIIGETCYVIYDPVLDRYVIVRSRKFEEISDTLDNKHIEYSAVPEDE